MKRVVQPRARALVHTLIADGRDRVPEDAGAQRYDAEALGPLAVPALIELLDSQELRERVRGASALLCISRYYEVQPEIIRRIEALLTESLAGSQEARYRACAALSAGPAPEGVIPSLERVLDDPDRRMRLFGAVALSVSKPRDPRALAILEPALHAGDFTLVSLAASALLRMEMRCDEAAQELLKWLLFLIPDAQILVLANLRYAGPCAIAAFPAVKSLVLYHNAHPAARYAAASTIGSICKGTGRAPELLLPLLVEANWTIFDGIVEGLRLSGIVPPEAALLLGKMTKHDKVEVRRAAIRSLGMMEAFAVPAIPVLIERADTETDYDTLIMIARTFSATGDAGVPALAHLLTTGRTFSVNAAVAALVGMREIGARTIAAILPRVADDRILQSLVMCLQELGVHASPAVPPLAKILMNAKEGHLALAAAQALHACGSSSAQAMPSLVDCVARRDDEVAWWAERVLGQFPTAAVAAIETAQQIASGNVKERLARVIGRLSALDDSRFGRLESLGDDSLLTMFLNVAGYIQEHGAVSFKRMEPAFEARRDQLGDIGFPTSARALLLGIESLEKHLKCRLIDRIPGRKGRLTQDAETLVMDVKEYFAAKAKRLGKT